MAGKIFVRQHAIFHTDSPQEMTDLVEAAKKAIMDGGGSIINLTPTDEFLDANADLTYVREMEYIALRTAL